MKVNEKRGVGALAPPQNLKILVPTVCCCRHNDLYTFKPIQAKMKNAPVHIISGPNAGEFGHIHSVQFDHDIQNTTYTVVFRGNMHDYYVDHYTTEQIPDRYITLPASRCAVYYNVGSSVIVASGDWKDHTGKVTECKYDADERAYYITILIPKEQIPCHPYDYLPSDTSVTFPAYMLRVY